MIARTSKMVFTIKIATIISTGISKPNNEYIMTKVICVVKSNQLSEPFQKSDFVRIWLDIGFNALIISDCTLY